MLWSFFFPQCSRMSCRSSAFCLLAFWPRPKVFCATSKYLQSGKQNLDQGLTIQDAVWELSAPCWAQRFARASPLHPPKGPCFLPQQNIIFINARLDFALACEDDEDNDDGVVIWGENVFYICQINAADAEDKKKQKEKHRKKVKERKVLGAEFSVRYSAFSYGFSSWFFSGHRRRKRKSCV